MSAAVGARELIDLDKVVARAEDLGADEVEVVLADVRSTEVVGVKNRIDRVTHTSLARVGFRVAIGKRVACYGSEVSGSRDVLAALEAAIKVARAMSEDKFWSGLPTELGSGGRVPVYDDRIAKLGVDEAVGTVYGGLTALSSTNPQIEPVSVELITSEANYVVANSYGGLVERFSTLATCFIQAKSRDGGREGVYSEYAVSRSLEGLRLNELISKVRERVVDALRAKPIETKRMDVIFEPKVVAGIVMAAFLPAITADNVQAGRSPLKGRIGQQVFSDGVTFTDDPFRPWLYGSRPFDDEGVSTRCKEVFSKGVLKTYLYDHYTARKDGVESTGNAWRSSPAAKPRPWATNLVIREGSASLDDLLSNCRECLLVCRTIGHWLSNPVSGHVTATVTHGYLVRKGEVESVVKGVGISSNIYEMLGRNLLAIGRGSESYLNIVAPPVMVRDVTVAGK